MATLPRIALLALLGGTLPAVAKTDWQSVGASDFAEVRLPSDPDAAAQVIFWNIEVDDRNYPNGRKLQEYIRYKIYDPEKSVPLTRLSELSASYGGQDTQNVSIAARLTLPDGTTKEFGSDAIEERALVQSGAEQSWAQRLFGGEGRTVKEKFLAISGMQAGAVLEFQITKNEYHVSPNFTYGLQKNAVPIHRLRYFQRLTESDDYRTRSFLANGVQMKAHFDSDPKKHTLLITGENLPALVTEPQSPSVNNRAMTLFGSYSAAQEYYRATHVQQMTLRVTPEDGPWAGIATRHYLWEADATYPQGSVKRAETAIDLGAASQIDKAQRIHAYVHQLYLRFLHSPNNERPLQIYAWPPLDHVMAFDQYPRDGINATAFLWLEVALDRAAGLETQALLLPDRRFLRFNPKFVSEMFLPQTCVRVRVEGNWKFSLSATSDPLPFGQLPASLQGQSALLVKTGKQEFVEVPEAPATESTVTNSGEFALGSDGDLGGTGRQTLTGEPALVLRNQLLRGSEKGEIVIVSRRLKQIFPSAELTVTSIAGRENPAAPIIIDYRVQMPDFAVATKQRLIFKPSLFHGNAPSPFSSPVRRNPVEFPSRWQEIDDFSLQLPSGFSFESPSAPTSYPGELLDYRVRIGYDRDAHLIHFHRGFISNLSIVPVAYYPTLKRLCDAIALSDQHDLVLTRAPRPSAPAAAKPGL